MTDELKPEGLSPETSPEENPAKVPPSPAERMGHPGVESRASVGVSTSSAAAGPQKKDSGKAGKEKKEDNSFPFSVTVGKVYDGPLDLLLDLIRKQDIDIYDIPIAKITAQFLAYVEQLKATDVDTAGEFIYMASLLIHIKSKMLLPRSPVETAEGEADDPRRELVERLLEHERFKSAAEMLAQRQVIEESTWSNPSLKEFRNDEGTEQEIAADTVDLVRVFREILDRLKERPVLDVEEDTVTVGQMIDYVRRRLITEDKPVALKKLLGSARSERTLIAMFLALLELVRLQAILLRQERNFSDIFIKKHADFEQVMTERMNQMRDDWS
jgi:segregation and condensation protein A